MAAKKALGRIRIELTAEQREQVKEATGVYLLEVELDPATWTPEALEERIVRFNHHSYSKALVYARSIYLTPPRCAFLTLLSVLKQNSRPQAAVLF